MRIAERSEKGPLPDLLDVLPGAVRENVAGYLDSIEGSLPAIFAQARVPFTEDVAGQFLFVAALRRIWILIDSQHVVLKHSLSLLERYSVEGFQIGGVEYSYSNIERLPAMKLRSALLSLLEDLRLANLVRNRSLSDMLAELERERHGPQRD